MIDGQEDLIRQALTYDFQSIVDISGGKGEASRLFAGAGKQVILTAFREWQITEPLPDSVEVIEHTLITDMRNLQTGVYDAVWCAHVLEHCPNPGLALSEMWRILKPNGHLFLSVPPYKPNLVGGHVSVGWNIGSMIYALLIAGFNVRNGAFVRHLYNIAAFVTKGDAPDDLLAQLEFSRGDIPMLQQHFPSAFQLSQNIYGDIEACQWEWKVHHATPGLRRNVKAFLRDKLLRLAYSWE